MEIKLKESGKNVAFDTKGCEMRTLVISEINSVILTLHPNGEKHGTAIAALSFDDRRNDNCNFNDMKKLGEEIARRWNECDKKL